MRSLFGYQRGGPVRGGEPGPGAFKTHPTSGARWDPINGIWMSPNSEQRVDPTTGETIGGGMLSPEADPVQDAVDQATGGNLAQEIMAYLGGDQAGVYREDYDIDGDGEISIRDSIYQMQTEGGLRNPDGTPVTEADPVQTAVDQATGGNLAQEIMAYLGTDAGDAGVYNEQYDFNKDGVVDMLDITASAQESTGLGADPVQDAVDQATGGVTAQDIMAYLGETGPFMEGMDVNKDGTVDQLDSVWQLQIQEGLRNPDGTPVAQPDPVTTTAPVFPTDTEPGTDTVGPAVNEYVSPQDQFLADYPDWATNPPTLPATPDPVQAAVNTAVGVGTTLPIETEPGMDTTTTTLPIETEPSTDPVQAAVDETTTTTQISSTPASSYGPVDNWGEPGYTAYDSTEQTIDPVESFVEDPVSPFMDEDTSNDTWTAPVVDVLETAGEGAGGDPRTDFTVVNDPTEPVTGESYSVGVIDPNATDPVTGVDPNDPGPDPVYYDEDTGTYTPPVDTTSAVDDMTETTGVSDMPTTNVAGDVTTTTGGFPDSPFEGMVHMDANNVTWTFVQGEWREVGPTGDTPVIGDTTTTTGDTTTVVDDTTTTGDTTVVDDTTTVVDDTTTTGDTTVTGQSEIDKLNALIAELRAEQEAQQAAQQAEREAWEAQTAAATGKYTLTGPSIGYNPYVSGQYQSDPYGAAGVPDFGGITTIPVPDAWQPPTLQPWQAPAPPAQALASWLEPMAQQTPTQPSNTWGQ